MFFQSPMDRRRRRFHIIEAIVNFQAIAFQPLARLISSLLSRLTNDPWHSPPIACLAILFGHVDQCIDAVPLRVGLLHAGYFRVQLEYFMLLPPPQQSATGFVFSCISHSLWRKLQNIATLHMSPLCRSLLLTDR